MANRIYNRVLYVDGDGKKRGITLDTDVIAAQTTAPGTGTPDIKGRVKVSGTRKALGCHPRGLRLTRLSGAAGSRILYDFMVVCSLADYNGYVDQGTITVGTNTWTIVSHVPEVIR